MNVLSLFDGISCGMLALERAGISVDRYVAYEIDENAIKVSKANYPQIEHCGDVTVADFTQYQGFDLLIGGSPCFTADTLVMTSDGLKEISNISVGDKVLTHTNSYKEVTNVINQGKKDIVEVYTMNADKIETTTNHLFYVRKKVRKWDSENRVYNRIFEEPQFMSISDLMQENNGLPNYKNYYCGVPINNNSIIPDWKGVDVHVNTTTIKHINNLDMNNEKLWYLVGRYLGDGWFRKNRKGKIRHNLNGVVICCGKHKIENFLNKLDGLNLNYNIAEEPTVYKLHFSNTELSVFFSLFGEYAGGKYIPGFVFDMPENLIKAMLDGYFESDGYVKDNKIKFSSISKKLVYGISYCVEKVYKRPVSIGLTKVAKTKIIENRLVNQNDYWTGSFKTYCSKNDRAFYEDGFIWYPINKIVDIKTQKETYDISVKDDMSFVANLAIVHNCQDLSSMGSKKGLEGEKSKLFFEYVRAMKEMNPKYFLLENNASMSKTNKDIMSSYMGVEPIMIDSANFSAQKRRRLYWTNIPVGEYSDKNIYLKDIVNLSDMNRNDVTDKIQKYVFSGQYDGRKINTTVKNSIRGFDQKSRTIGCQAYEIATNTGLTFKIGDRYYQPTQEEFEALQTLPSGYTSCLPIKKAVFAIGNGWTVDVIAHIFKGLTGQVDVDIRQTNKEENEQILFPGWVD